MNVETWLLIISSILGSSFLTTLGNAWLTKRKTSVEIEEKINNMQAQLIDDQEMQYKQSRKENAELKAEHAELKAENVELRKEIAELKECNKERKTQANRRKQENIMLRGEIDQMAENIRGLG